MSDRTSVPQPPPVQDPTEQEAPAVKVAGPVADVAQHGLAGLVCWLVAGSALLAVAGWKLWGLQASTAQASDLLYQGLLVLGLAALVHAALGRPLVRLIHQVRRESARLRAAMTCPYCKDGLQHEALLCGRPGCGAAYHPECWSECRTGYGGCAVYGCGHTAAEPIGRFALRRRVFRLVIAAALFPPRAVASLRELDGQSLRDVWREAREHQREISRSPARTLAYGAISAAVCEVILLAVVLATVDMRTYVHDMPALFSRLGPVFVLPFVFLRAPLAGALLRGSGKLLARAFRGELGALSRADRGTVLGRLLAGAGKKD